MKRTLGAAIAAAFLAMAAAAQTAETTRAAGVPGRGDHVMGFDHAKTTHHFRLTRSGGRIEAEAKDPADSKSRDQIRAHLAHIAKIDDHKTGDSKKVVPDSTR